MLGATARSGGSDERDTASAQHGMLARLREAARAYETSGDEGPLREVTRAIAADAAARGLRAEELVIAFKQLWTSVPELSPLRRHSRTVVDDLVTLCINEYYRRTPRRA